MQEVNIGGLSAVLEEGTAHKLAILLPGNLDSKNYQHLKVLSEDLVKEAGFDVVRFDPTGSWDSVGEIGQYTITQYINDVKRIIGFSFAKKSYSDVVLIGHSLGGEVAILAGLDPRVTKVVAIMSPATYARIENQAKIDQWQRDGFYISIRELPGDPNQKREFKVPYSFVEDSKKYNAGAVAGNLNKPLLFITGEKDDTVLPETVRKIYETASEPKKFVELSNIGHDFRFNLDEIKVVNRTIIDWLKGDG